MRTRLFHTLVVYGSALGSLTLACASGSHDGAGDDGAGDDGGPLPPDAAGGGAGASNADNDDRCLLPDGGCNEHCAPLVDGGCLDPCFVHTADCSRDCLQSDGSCGWPPTK